MAFKGDVRYINMLYINFFYDATSKKKWLFCCNDVPTYCSAIV